MNDCEDQHISQYQKQPVMIIDSSLSNSIIQVDNLQINFNDIFSKVKLGKSGGYLLGKSGGLYTT